MPRLSNSSFVACPKCFKLKRPKTAICPSCKFREEPLASQLYLPYRTRLCNCFHTGLILGKGEASVIYLAYQNDRSELLALKEYFPRRHAQRRPDGYVSPRREFTREFADGMAAFRKEFEILSNLEHDSIVGAREIVECNGTCYIVMDFCGYESLEKSTQSRLTELQILTLMAPIFEALETVHASSILHCDINPENIQIKSPERPILLDFGSAIFQDHQRDISAQLTFKPGYSAPEQHTKKLDLYRPWTDVYSCAATLYRLSTGIKPPRADARVKKDTLEEPSSKNPNLSLSFSDAIKRGLALDPYDRPTSIQEFRSLLNRENISLAVVAREPGRTLVQGERIISSVSTVMGPFIVLLLIVATLCFILQEERSGEVGKKPLSNPIRVVEPADFYILRDVSLTIDRVATVDLIENSFRDVMRLDDEADGRADFTRYAYFAAGMSDGTGTQQTAFLQPAARGDNIKLVKDRLSPSQLSNEFRSSTNFKEVFDQAFHAIQASRIDSTSREREIFVVLITDGMPDREGKRSACLDMDPSKELYPILDIPTQASFDVLVRSKAHIIVALAGGDPGCARALEQGWARTRMDISPPLRELVSILPLSGYEGKEAALKKQLKMFLGTIRRAPVVSVRPASDRLDDGQRELFDRGDKFHADFAFQPHLCELVKIKAESAEILNMKGDAVGDMNIANVDGGVFDIASMGAPRNGESDIKPIFFEVNRRFKPKEGESYQLRLKASGEASFPNKPETRFGVPIAVENNLLLMESGSTQIKKARTYKLELLVLVYACAGIVFSAALVVYWRLEGSERRHIRRWIRKFFVSPLQYWLVGFFSIAAILFIESARLISLRYLLWFVPAGFLLFKSRDLIKRADPSKLSSGDIFLSCFDSVLVPLAALLELLY